MQIQPPFIVSYSITTKCNLKCKHCYSESVDQAAPDELSTEEAFRLMDDLANWGIRLLVIDGGEPLCREDTLDVVKYASSKGIRTTIGSNGTLIDEAMAKKMLEAGVKAVAISVDGADAQTHDTFRGESGTFEDTLRGIEACRTAGLPFQFNTVIRKETLPQLEDILNMAVNSGANAAELFDLVVAGRAKQECREEVLDLDVRKRTMEWLAMAQVDCPIVIRVPACPMYPLLLQQQKIKPKHFPIEILRRIPYYGRGCAAGMPMGYMMVKCNGEVNPCMLLQVNLGNIREQSIILIWENSPVLAELRQRQLKGECGDCSYKVNCSGCRGRAYEETGDMMATDPGCWLAPEVAKENQKQYERLNKLNHLPKGDNSLSPSSRRAPQIQIWPPSREVLNGIYGWICLCVSSMEMPADSSLSLVVGSQNSPAKAIRALSCKYTWTTKATSLTTAATSALCQFWLP